MTRAILYVYKTEAEAEACLEAIFGFVSEECRTRYSIIDDTDYNGQWTVNIDWLNQRYNKELNKEDE